MKNIIITGSSSGFGLKAVKDFADRGYQVFATMRKPDTRTVVGLDYGNQRKWFLRYIQINGIKTEVTGLNV